MVKFYLEECLSQMVTNLYVFCSSSKYSWNVRIEVTVASFFLRGRHPPNSLTRLVQITRKIFTMKFCLDRQVLNFKVRFKVNLDQWKSYNINADKIRLIGKQGDPSRDYTGHQ